MHDVWMQNEVRKVKKKKERSCRNTYNIYGCVTSVRRHCSVHLLLKCMYRATTDSIYINTLHRFVVFNILYQFLKFKMTVSVYIVHKVEKIHIFNNPDKSQL